MNQSWINEVWLYYAYGTKFIMIKSLFNTCPALDGTSSAQNSDTMIFPYNPRLMVKSVNHTSEHLVEEGPEGGLRCLH